ncbi:MAG: ATP-binding cassette domain-containing protein [Flavobacteriales bacterium]|nr:ATP-binding cassette domain-containing protein [Flavobacteriales bacterium]
MFKITLKNAGKRYNYEWIFRSLEGHYCSGDTIAILGGNGSGKSTMLRSIFGYAPLSEGSIEYTKDGISIKQPEAYKHFSICAPYLELYEELTLSELVKFHFSFKSIIPDIEQMDFAAILELDKSASKQVKFFSSGMKQRVRIGLAVLSDVSAIFLDEPSSNLDQKAAKWYRNLIEKYKRERIVFVASNGQSDEYFFTQEKIDLENFKPS